MSSAPRDLVSLEAVLSLEFLGRRTRSGETQVPVAQVGRDANS